MHSLYEHTRCRAKRQQRQRQRQLRPNVHAHIDMRMVKGSIQYNVLKHRGNRNNTNIAVAIEREKERDSNGVIKWVHAGKSASITAPRISLALWLFGSPYLHTQYYCVCIISLPWKHFRSYRPFIACSLSTHLRTYSTHTHTQTYTRAHSQTGTHAGNALPCFRRTYKYTWVLWAL